jgi:hypothetical protein
MTWIEVERDINISLGRGGYTGGSQVNTDKRGRADHRKVFGILDPNRLLVVQNDDILYN